MARRIFLLTVVLSFVFISRIGFASDTFEPNDTPGTAYRIYSGEKKSRISTSSDVDWYFFWAWGGLQAKVELTVPAGRNYDLELWSGDLTLLAWSRNGTGMNEQVLYTPSMDQSLNIKVVGFQGSHDPNNDYTLKVSWSAPTQAVLRNAAQYVYLSGTWYMRPWVTSNPELASRLACPNSDTHSRVVTSGVPYGLGGKDLTSHVTKKLAVNSGYAHSRFYDYWHPVSNRSVMYSPNIYYIGGSSVDANGNSDASRQLGWVGVDCGGLVQRSVWLGGYKATTDATSEYGRIGTLDSKGNIVMNTTGNSQLGGTYWVSTTLAQDVTPWIPADGTSPITYVSGMSPTFPGDIVVYRNSSGEMCHVAIVSHVGAYPATQANTKVLHSCWGESTAEPEHFARSWPWI